jgi:hypothetical protein
VKSVIRRWHVPLHAVIPRIGAGCIITIAAASATVVSVGSWRWCPAVANSSDRVFDEAVMRLFSTSYERTHKKKEMNGGNTKKREELVRSPHRPLVAFIGKKLLRRWRAISLTPAKKRASRVSSFGSPKRQTWLLLFLFGWVMDRF